jgi:hypothetical protein
MNYNWEYSSVKEEATLRRKKLFSISVVTLLALISLTEVDYKLTRFSKLVKIKKKTMDFFKGTRQFLSDF